MADKLLGSFPWCELMTTDTAAAGAFYSKVVGWKTTPFSPDGSYLTFNTKSGPAGGLLALPDDAKRMGTPPNWMIYVGTPNVDDTAQRVAQLRGRVLKQPADIPGTGRYAVVQDPYGATFGLYTPKTPGPGRGPDVGDWSWFELYTPNPEGAWNFYQSLFGWEKTSAMDMGEMGVYQMFGRGGGIPNGGIMKPPPGGPAAWQPYVRVADAKAAAATAQAAGGKIVNGPMEVPGGDWIAQGMDPQGAMFAVHSLKPAATRPRRRAKPAAAKKAAKAKPAKKAKAAATCQAGQAREDRKANGEEEFAKKTTKKTARKNG